MYFSLKRPVTLSFSILYQVFMVMGEVDIGIRPANIIPITVVVVAYFRVAMLLLLLFTEVFMVMREVYICLITATLIPKTVVDNTVPRRVYLKIIFLGVADEKLFKTLIKIVPFIRIKTILITIIQAWNHKPFFCVHIALLLLFMHPMDSHTICIYHPLSIYIFYHTVVFPPISSQTYFLLIGVLIFQVGLPTTGLIGRFPAQDTHFALILWYLAKTIPNFYELSLFSSRISSKYFDGDINLVHAL